MLSASDIVKSCCLVAALMTSSEYQESAINVENKAETHNEIKYALWGFAVSTVTVLVCVVVCGVSDGNVEVRMRVKDGKRGGRERRSEVERKDLQGAGLFKNIRSKEM